MTITEARDSQSDLTGKGGGIGETIAARIARWAADVTVSDVPTHVADRALLHILDCVGLAYASSNFDFAKRALAAVSELGAGNTPVIGHSVRLSPRDAALLNGLLVHGLDYDDTHLAGVIHASASALPTALSVSTLRHLPGKDLLLGYLIAMEVSSRVGAAANSGLHAHGYHPTGVVGAFGSAVAAARLGGLSAQGIATAQGFVGSLASGVMEFLETGAWTKRVHPGWAAVSGITAAQFAKHGFESPPAIYEGRFGLFALHTPLGHGIDLSKATAGLGEDWELVRVGIKPYPACHFTHAFADAAQILLDTHKFAPSDIESITCLVPEEIVPVVLEPAANKLSPRSDYHAKFSLPFIVSAILSRGRFTLAELEDEALRDPEILSLAAKVAYEPDPNKTFPKYFHGEVIVRLKDGRELRHRENDNRGSEERPLSREDIETKFYDNMSIVSSRSHAERVHEAVMGLLQEEDSANFAEALRG
ncbi:MmgE/PrpD family protein [Micromonospora sp. NPDC005806]|uniref:MmgE/PrpD family protein n=1 Tax=Micromonospora sp. NPDC005806 TaxID=3364234 RepID=UPI0036CAC280